MSDVNANGVAKHTAGGQVMTQLTTGAVIECDATAIGLWKDCPRKFDLRINRGLVPKARVGGGRGMGGALHRAREVWRTALMSGVHHDVALTQGLGALSIEWNASFGAGIVDEKRSLANAENLFRGYAAKFGSHNYTPIAIEKPFSIAVGTTPAGHVVNRTGLMDEYCEFNGRRYVLDLKTSSVYPGGSWMDAWRTSEQFLGYVFAAQAIYGQCDGVIVHGIWVHTPPQRSTNKYKFEDYFTADIISFSAAQVEEWRDDFLHTIDRREEARARNHWSPNLGSTCKTVYGLCDFHKWCSSTPEIRPQVENIYYAHQVWQPLAESRLGDLTAIGVP